MPPFRRAYRQLKMNVRALPTCKNPVGDGANRTRNLLELDESVGVDMRSGELPMVRGRKTDRQAPYKTVPFSLQPFLLQRNRRRGNVLKTSCL